MPYTVVHILGTLGAGGEERQALTLVKEMDTSRWRPVILCALGGVLHDEFAQYAPVHVIGKRHKVDLGTVRRMRRLLAEYQPDIIHTHLFTANTWGRLAAAWPPWRRPIVVAQEGNIEVWKNWMHHLPDRLLMTVTDAIIGNSDDVSRYMSEHEGIPARKIRTIYNGIDLGRSQKWLGSTDEVREGMRAQLGFRPGDIVVGNAGRSASQKNLPLLLRVISDLKERWPEVRLLRVGQPPGNDDERAYQARFEEEAAALGLAEDIVVHPFTPDISSAFLVMDVLVQTSDFEGLPNVILEGMSMELPVVATAAGGTGNVVRHRRNGWLVQTGDRAGLVEGIAHAIEHRDIAAEWAAAGRKLIEDEYSSRALMRKTTDLYEELLRNRGVLPPDSPAA